MPNYVANVIKMKGIANLPLFVTDKGRKCFDFNKLIPMPESLNMPSGSMTEHCIMYYLTERCTVPLKHIGEEKLKIVDAVIQNQFFKNWPQEVFNRTFNEAYAEPKVKQDEMYENGRKYVENYKNYGAVTWYDWCCDNWGTKWNAGGTTIIDEDTICFSTAWDAPGPVIDKLSKTYPDTEIEVWYADEDRGSNTGHMICKDGAVISGGVNENCSDEAYKTYNFCWNVVK